MYLVRPMFNKKIDIPKNKYSFVAELGFAIELCSCEGDLCSVIFALLID